MTTLFIVLFLTLAAEFVNGWTDAPNAIATVVSTRVMSIRLATFMVVIMNVIGAISGTAVAHTIGTGFVDPKIMSLPIIGSGLFAIILWGAVTGYIGIPTSKTHELVAGITGAALAIGGPEALLSSGWIKIGYGLLASSLCGFLFAYILAKSIYLVGSNSQWSPRTARLTFDRLQILSAGMVAYNHGMNDGQKFIGIFTIALVTGGVLPAFQVPLWVAILCAIVMGIGTSFGGKRIILTLGDKMTRIQSWQGFCAESGSSLILFLSSLTGVPISTTHTVDTSIMGAGAAVRMNAVNWGYALHIVMAWFFTFPICLAIGYAIALAWTSIAPMMPIWVRYITVLF